MNRLQEKEAIWSYYTINGVNRAQQTSNCAVKIGKGRTISSYYSTSEVIKPFQKISNKMKNTSV